jgi:predicted DNA-binding transcriptional regulator AlpA
VKNEKTIAISTAMPPKRRGRPPLPEAERQRRAAERKKTYRNPTKSEILAKPGVIAAMSLPLEGRMLGIHEVCARTNKAVSGVYSSINAGEFPPPVKSGKRAVVWRGVDIVAWMKCPVGWRPVAANDSAPTTRAA